MPNIMLRETLHPLIHIGCMYFKTLPLLHIEKAALMLLLLIFHSEDRKKRGLSH